MRSRLTLLVAATTSLVLAAFLIPLAMLVSLVAEDRAVDRATRSAQAIVPVVATGDRSTIEQAAAGAVGYPITVFLPDGTSVGERAERSTAVELAATGRSLTARTPGGREIVVAVGMPEGTAVIRTEVPVAELRQGVTRAWLLLAAIGVVLVGLGLLVADRLARAVVRPIAALSAVSHRLAGGDLSARADPKAGPPEVRGVAAALNHLADRIRELLQQERETVADLSHRLRTPLTALRLEAEALPDREHAARVADRVDAVERAVTGLIRQARLRSDRGTGRCDAAAVVRERLDFWSVLAEDTARAVTADLASGPLPVALAADELAAAVDALLGNVFAHTPDGVAFAIRLVALPDGGAELTVDDEGPGLPVDAADPTRRGVSGGTSTGLGLDIARRAGEDSGGELRLEATPTGTGARVVLVLGRTEPNA